MNPSFVVVNDSYGEPPGDQPNQKASNYWQEDALEQDEAYEWGGPLSQPHDANEEADVFSAESDEAMDQFQNLITNSDDEFSDIQTEDDFKEAFDEGFGFEDEDEFDLDEDELNPEVLLQNQEKLDGLLESFLDLEQPRLNRNMINFLKTDKATQRFLRFLSRLPENMTVDDSIPEVNYSRPIPPKKLRNQDDPREIRIAKLSYNLMDLLSPVFLPEQKFASVGENRGDHAKTFVMCKFDDICAHSLCCFHPISYGNPHHASNVLESALSSLPSQFYSMVCRNKLINRLFKNFLLRGSHLGKAADLIGSMISYIPTFGADIEAQSEEMWETAEELGAKIIKLDQLLKNSTSEQAAEWLAAREVAQGRFNFLESKREFFKLIRDWNFFECIINVVASREESDTIAFTYAHFFRDLLTPCSSVPEGELLLTEESALRLTKTLLAAALDPKNRRGHRVLVVELLSDFLTHLSKESFLQEVPNSILFLGLSPPAPKPNRFHKLLLPTLSFVLSEIPILVTKLSCPESIGPKKIRRRPKLTPFGTLRITLLRLLTTCFSLTRFIPNNGISLSVIRPKYWEKLFKWVLAHGSNNFLLLEFSKLIDYSLVGSPNDRAFLLYLLRECHFIEKLIAYYCKTKPRTALHSFTLVWLSKLQIPYQNDLDSNTSEGVRSQDSTQITGDFGLNQDCKEDEILGFIRTSKAYNEFLPTLNATLNLQKLQDVPVFNSGSGNSQLEYLLQALLTSVSQSAEPQTSQEDPNCAVDNGKL